MHQLQALVDLLAGICQMKSGQVEEHLLLPPLEFCAIKFSCLLRLRVRKWSKHHCLNLYVRCLAVTFLISFIHLLHLAWVEVSNFNNNCLKIVNFRNQSDN